MGPGARVWARSVTVGVPGAQFRYGYAFGHEPLVRVVEVRSSTVKVVAQAVLGAVKVWFQARTLTPQGPDIA